MAWTIRQTATIDSMPNVTISVVIPCLNEADTLGTCIDKSLYALRQESIDGEIIIADNGSTDGSLEIAKQAGVSVIHVPAQGYGNALMCGIAAAKGEFVIMGDADEGYDLVQGCRLPAGGGTILPGAMPYLHRVIGNPVLSLLARHWFQSPLHDIYCGLRGFRKDFYTRLDQRCTGMEFATEMIIKASLRSRKITEIPITLHPDGRKSHAPHLRTFRDGWRTIRLFLLYSPRWLFLIPGACLLLAGVMGYLVALPGLTFAGVTFDSHTLLFASLTLLCGYQLIIFAISAKTFAISEGFLPEDPRMNRFFQLVNLERGLVISVIGLLIGIGLLSAAVIAWYLTGFGRLDYAQTMRLVIPGATITALAIQTIFSSFFVSILGMARR